MSLLRILRFGGAMLFAMVMFAPGSASQSCVSIEDWNDLVNAVKTTSTVVSLCKFDIAKTASSERIVLNKRLTISCFGATETEKCTIRGPGSHFHIDGSAAEVLVDGFAFHGASECAVRVLSTARKTQVLQNCDFVKNEGNSDVWRGGAIKTELSTSLIVRACNFVGNKAEGGGAIFHRGSNLLIFESDFRDNVAKDGGAVMNDNRAFFSVHGSSFVNNTATGSQGGAIRVRDPRTLTRSSNVVGNDNVPCNGVYSLINDHCDEFDGMNLDPFAPGELTVLEQGLLLSTGLTLTLLATAGEFVELSSPEAPDNLSTTPFHAEPDGAAVFELEDGGWVYISNSEIPSNGGGVYGLEFYTHGHPRYYSQRLNNTSRNCAGGVTPWNTWVSCEEFAHGQCWQVDPTGQRNPEETKLVEPTGGNFESMAVDDRDPDQMKFFVTEDHERGALRRFTTSAVSPSWEMLHMNGKIDYLQFLPNGRFQWTPSISIGRQSAYDYYPNVEGIAHDEGILSFVSKQRKQIFHLRLDLGTYKVESTFRSTLPGGGSFGSGSDQIVLLSDVLYFTKDGGRSPGIYAHDGTRMYTLVEAYDTKFQADETTGIGFSPDGTKIYFSFQEIGYLFQVERQDGLPFAGNRRLLSLRYHRG